MKYFSVEMSIQGSQALCADFVSVTKTEEALYFSIKFIGLKPHPQILIKDGAILDVNLQFGKDVYSSFRLESSYQLTISSEMDDYEAVFLGDAILNDFPQMKYEIMRSWSLEDERYEDWRKLPETEKWPWLMACLGFGKPLIAIEPYPDVAMDCSNVNSLGGFYCLLGETLRWKRGYFGANLDALEDCVRSCKKSEEKRQIRFVHFDQLQKLLDTPENFEIYGEAYTGIIIEIFEAGEFEVVVEN